MIEAFGMESMEAYVKHTHSHTTHTNTETIDASSLSFPSGTSHFGVLHNKKKCTFLLRGVV